MTRRTALAIVLSAAMVTMVWATPSGANSDSVSGSPLTCTTSPDFGNQVASWTSTVSDDHDPAAVGDTMTYRFVVPFAQDPPPVAASYRGGTVHYKIPTGFSVTSVHTEIPSGGSPVSSSAAVQGADVVVTSTADFPMDGTRYPTPDLVVTGTVGSGAAGPGVVWAIPHLVIANVFVNGFGMVVATCTPDAPATVIGKTVVPGANQPPTATDRTVGIPAGTATPVTLTGTDPDGDALTYSVTTPPAHGTLSGTAPKLTYTPASGFVGTDTLGFQVADGRGGTDLGTITLNVFSGIVLDQTPPTITLTAPTNGAVYAPTDVVLAAFDCADTTTTVKTCTGTVASGAPVAMSVGVHSFTVKATDSQGNQARQLVSYRVIDPKAVVQHYTGTATDTVGISCDTQVPPTPTSLPLVVSAPLQVPVGGTFNEQAALGAQEVPALLEWTALKYTFSPPVGATVTAVQTVPGTASANSGLASATVVNGRAVLSLPGPIDGGTTAATTFTPPAVLVTMTATGGPATTARTGFEQFEVTRGGAGIPTAPGAPPATQTVTCPATSPRPVTSRTTILDVTPPQVLLRAPAHGAVYTTGDSAKVDFGCSDAAGTMTTCSGTAANGSQLATGSAGTKTFVVDGTDAAGNTAEAFASYVVHPPTVTYTANVDWNMLAGMNSASQRFGIPIQDIPKAGVGLIMFLRALDPSGAPNPIVPPPANSGPIAVPSTYPYAQQIGIENLAAFYSVTGDQLHWLGAGLLVYLDAISPH